MKANVAERGQVTIPKSLRKRLRIRHGTLLDFTVEGGRLVAVKAEPSGSLEQIYGRFGHARKTDEIMETLRGDLDHRR